MINGNNATLDSKVINGVNTQFNLIKTKFNEEWLGIAATAYNLSLDEIISAIDKLCEEIHIFKLALEKLEIYKANKVKIADLEQLISQEKANPSLKSTETYVENGITKTGIVYVVNQALIDKWQAEINRLVEENNRLKSEINNLLNSIAPVNISPKNNSDIAHRGYHPGGTFENSLEAFIKAGQQGFWGCETDVRFDTEGNLVCSHNAVKNGENPPTIEQYLDICKEYGMTAIIDLKYAKNNYEVDTELSKQILETIKEKGMMNSCILQTDNPRDVPYIREISKEARIWYLTSEITDNNINLAKENNVECVNFRTGDNNIDRINKLTENEIDVCVWGVTEESIKNNLLNNGAKYVMSDHALGTTPYQKGEEDFNKIAT